MTRHVVLYSAGTYLFAKHQNGISRMIEKLQHPVKQSYEKSEELKYKLVKIDKEMNQIISWNLFLLVLIPLLVKFAPIVIGMFIKHKYKWNSWEFELFEMFSILYTRVASLPFYFYVIYCGFVQRLQIERYSENIKHKSYKGTLDDAFQEYVLIHRDINEHSENYKSYIKIFFTIVITWGTLYAYFSVGNLKNLTTLVKTSTYIAAAYDYFAPLLKYALEVIILFSVLYYRLLRVEEQQEEVMVRFNIQNYQRSTV